MILDVLHKIQNKTKVSLFILSLIKCNVWTSLKIRHDEIMYSVMGNTCTDFLTFDGPVLWLTEDVLNSGLA